MNTDARNEHVEEITEYARKHGRITNEQVMACLFVGKKYARQMMTDAVKKYPNEFVITRNTLVYIPQAKERTL